jgi:hypothetical protein
MAVAVILVFVAPSFGGEIVRLNESNWSLVPGGKEVDAIYGDYLLRNDQVVVVVANTVPGRNAMYSCRNVQGAVIDFTLRETNNDQLTAFMPHGDPYVSPAATQAEIVTANGAEVRLRVVRPAHSTDPIEIATEYALRDGEQFLRVTTRYRNTNSKPASRRVSDKMRCDQTFTQTPEGEFAYVSFYDKWFRAAYGVARPQGKVYTNGRYGGMFGPAGGTFLDYPDLIKDASSRATVMEPNQEVVLTRYLIAGRHDADVQWLAQEILQQQNGRVAVAVMHAQNPVVGADVVAQQNGKEVCAAYTDAQGKATFGLPSGKYTFVVSQIGRATKTMPVTVASDANVVVEMGPLSQVSFNVTDEAGKPSPCKVQFIGIAGTPEPDLGPRQRANGCQNLYFSPNGKFTAPLPAGRYYVLISRGPEYDAVYRYLNLNEGQTARIAARLVRVLDSKGWISADFHNHSTESGDNTTETESRIVCLAAEGVEFAASTEHNRLQTYRHRLKALGLDKLMATSDGIELTGSPLPLNHHNAFPLKLKPGAQDGGGPLTDVDPREQIKRLAEHDDKSEKLVQQNHPDIGWLFYDKDGDGQPDTGFGAFEFTHVIEIWMTNVLAMQPTTGSGNNLRNNRIFNWLQLLNQGFRLPGVANTDAHYCFHDSGTIRNYVKSPTDDPSQVNEMDVVRESKKGRIVMTNGPFMEVSFNGALPGDDVKLSNGKGTLRVRVQCANWLDVDRVQVLVNGRPDPKLNFTRASHPQFFRDGVVKFEREVSVTLTKDAHIIVVAAGESATTGPVMGQRGEPPIAISNPIYVDVDGNGFQASKDTLDAPLPTKKS